MNKKHGWILDSDLYGLDEGIEGHGRDLHVALVDLALRHEARVAGELTQALGAAEQDVGAARLGQADEHQDQDRGRCPDGDRCSHNERAYVTVRMYSKSIQCLLLKEEGFYSLFTLTYGSILALCTLP